MPWHFWQASCGSWRGYYEEGDLTVNLNDPTNARRALVDLLRNPQEWPEEFVFNWETPGAKHFGGYVYGCAKVLAKYTGIVSSPWPESEIGIGHAEYNKIFMDANASDPSAIADRLEAVRS